MDLILHVRNGMHDLSSRYRHAFSQATELYMLTAYMTAWDSSLELAPYCKSLKIVVGQDFGITRKLACEKVISWMGDRRGAEFRVYTGADSFHPKALLWRERDDKCYAVIGSSNFTRAAFETNFEANAYARIDEVTFNAAKAWILGIIKDTTPVADWLPSYKEAPRSSRRRDITDDAPQGDAATWAGALRLPRPRGMHDKIERRRRQLLAYLQHREPLLRLFRAAGQGRYDNQGFLASLNEVWNTDLDNRLQGPGFMRSAGRSNVQELSRSYLKILNADADQRDAVVQQEIDRLGDLKVTMRGAFLSEMLCLEFPDAYPILNEPMYEFLQDMGFRAPRRTTQGARYIDLAWRLRSALAEDVSYPARNLAELDVVVWLVYGKHAQA